MYRTLRRQFNFDSEKVEERREEGSTGDSELAVNYEFGKLKAAGASLQNSKFQEKSANHHHPIIPTVVLVTRDRQIFEMECEMETPEPRGSMMFLRYTVYFFLKIKTLTNFQLTTTNFGNPFKVRLSSEEDGPDVETHVHKVSIFYYTIQVYSFDYYTSGFEQILPTG